MKLLEDLKLDLIEVQAYRELQDCNEFNDYFFNYDMWNYILGKYEIINTISEDAYYEMDIQNLEQAIEDYDIDSKTQIKIKPKLRLNKYDRKKITQQKLINLKGKCAYYVIGENEEYLYRCYLSKRITGRTHLYKKISNKKIRKCNHIKLKGNNYRKIFDYRSAID